MSRSNLLFQSEEHPLIADTFSSVEEYCLSLIHGKAYAVAEELARGRDVLDLGCNHGYGTRKMSESAASIVGIDVSNTAIESARRRHPSLRFLLVDGQVLPFEDARFDLVTTFQVIEHIEQPEEYLREIRRVLRPGGTVMFTTPNRPLRLDPGMKPWNPFHVREYTAEELKALLTQHFAEVQVRGLFAKPALYDIEYRRAREAKHRARGGRWWKDPVLIGAKARRLLRKRADPRLTSQQSAAKFGEFSIADLFYRDEALDGALDLMAICRS